MTTCVLLTGPKGPLHGVEEGRGVYGRVSVDREFDKLADPHPLGNLFQTLKGHGTSTMLDVSSYGPCPPPTNSLENVGGTNLFPRLRLVVKTSRSLSGKERSVSRSRSAGRSSSLELRSWVYHLLLHFTDRSGSILGLSALEVQGPSWSFWKFLFLSNMRRVSFGRNLP